MAKVRKIIKNPEAGKNYYLVDSCFLANKHIPSKVAPPGLEQTRILACQEWWQEIERQVQKGVARVFIPDVCIAEAFKVLARKYYAQKWFKSPQDYNRARNNLSSDIRVGSKALKASARKIGIHDISTNRDIIISVDRYFELFLKSGKNVQIADLILVATGKYLMDFYDIPKDRLHIVTMDTKLREGIAIAGDLPNAYDPTLKSQSMKAIFW